jgi:hypothetical protein
VLLEKVTVEQPSIARDELLKRAGGPALAMGRNELYPGKRERLVVLVRGSVLRGDVTDGRGHRLLRRPEPMPVEVVPRELQMLPVAEPPRLVHDTFESAQIRRPHACSVASELHYTAARMSVSARCRAVTSLVALTMAGCATVAGAAVSPTVEVARLLGSRISSVKQHDGGVPVLLPTTMALGSPDYTASSATHGSYSLEIDGAEPCNGANVCLYALFTGVRGGRGYGSVVELAHRIHGRFADIQCGAACSSATIDWIERGVLYTIEANPSIESHPNVSAKAFEDVFIDAGPR